MTDHEILQSLLDNGIIDLNGIQKLQMNHRNEILEKSGCKVYQNKDGTWITRLPADEDGKRKLVKRKKKEEVEDIIISTYLDENVNSFKARYKVWYNRQKNCARADNTLNRYETDFLRFFAGTSMEKADVTTLTDEDISIFYTEKLRNTPMTYRQLRDMHGMLNMILDKAVMDKVIEVNPCKYVDVPLFRKFCKQTRLKQTEERIVSDDELKRIFEKLDRQYEKDPSYMPRYAVEMAIYTGMRVGELAGLMWEDIDFRAGIIHIRHSEKYNRVTKEFFVSFTKTGKERLFPITDDILNLLERIKKYSTNEYVFSDADGRVHTNRISSCIKNITYCKDFDHVRSIHSIRRTLNSKMRCNGVSPTIAASLLGHTEKVNELNYTYDTSAMDYKAEIVKNATKITPGNNFSLKSNNFLLPVETRKPL